MIAGTLEIQILTGIARLQQDMNQAKATVSGAMGHIASAAGMATRALGALGVGISAAALAGSIKGYIDLAASLDDIAEKTGASVEELSKLEQVVRIGGHSMETAETALIRLAKALHGSDDEAKGAGKALAALGLSAERLRNMDTAEALKIVAVEMAKYKDGAGKTALAMDLLSKMGAQALPFLKDLATEQGIATRITAQQAAEAEELGKSWARLSNQSRMFGQSLALDMVPWLQKMIDRMAEAKRIGGDFLGTLHLLANQTSVFGSPGENLTKLRVDLAEKEGKLAGLSGVDPLGIRSRTEASIAGIKKQIEWEKFLQRQQALSLKGGDTTGETARMGGGLGVLDYAGNNSAIAKGIDDAEKKLEEARKRQIQDAIRVGKLDLDAFTYYEKEKRGIEEASAKDREDQIKERIRLGKDDLAAFEYFASEKRKIEEADQKILDEAKAEMKRRDEEVSRSLTDALMRGFEGGKDSARNFIDTLKNMFRTLILKPVIQWVLSPVTGAISAALGSILPGTASASGGISSMLGLGNSAASLAGGAGSGLYGAFATSGIGQSLGLSSILPDAIGLGALEGGGTMALSGLGAGLGAALPYVGIALAAASALGLFKSNKKPASFSGGRLTGSAGMSGFEGTLFGTSTSDPNNPLMNQWVNAESGHVSDLLQAPVKAAFDEMRKLAELLKLDTSRLAEVRATFDLTNVGQIGAEVLPAFEQNIGTLTDSIALGLMPNLADFAQQGESLTATFARLASAAEEADQQVQAVNMEAVTAAQDVLREAYKAQADDLTQSISKWADAAQTLRDYGASLAGGSGGLSYSAAAARFAITAAQARSGSVDAMGNLQSASEAFRIASLAHSGSSSEYTRDVLKIRSAVGDSADLADRNRSLVQQQLDSLTALVEGQITVNERLVTVEEAIARLASANADMARDTKRAADTLEGAANGQFEFSTVAA